MIHDPDLLDAIAALPFGSLGRSVFRATGLTADSTVFSHSGGRWAPADEDEGGFPILYTSLDRDGAVAEVASYLSLLSPVPRKSLKVSEIGVTTQKTLTLTYDRLGSLGINTADYSARSYKKTQIVGAAINFLGYDGLIAPSARWNCENLMIFETNHLLDLQLDVLSSEEVTPEEWSALATRSA